MKRGARLSEHFALAEFVSHDGARVPAAHARELAKLCRDYLEPLRAMYGPVRIVSGFRSVEHNRSVGGAGHSYHTHERGRPGAAADVTCARGTPRQWHAFLEARGPGGLGLYPTWVHVDNRDGHARWTG